MAPDDWAAMIRELQDRGFVVIAQDPLTEVIVIRPIATR